MKRMFCMLLVGALTLPLIGCNASAATDNGENTLPPQPMNKGADNTQEATVSTRLAEAYYISIETEEQQVYQLSASIDTIPVQPRPATQSLKEDFSDYLSALQNICTRLTAYAGQVEEDRADGDLERQDYEAIIFQLDQLSSRIQGLKDTLCVVYGINDTADAAA